MTGPIRRTAEVVLGPLRITRRLPASVGGGRIVASAQVGGLKYLFKRSEDWDAELLRISKLLVSEGDIVWDVGANVGLFSISSAAASGRLGHVVAFEADIDAVALLNASNRYRTEADAELTVVPVAIGGENGFARFAIAKRARASNALFGHGSTQMGGIKEIRTLPCFSLDALLEHFPVPDVLKIDVEGAEVDVLKGACRLLDEIRPRVYCEVASSNRDEVTSLLHGHRYRLWDGAVFGGSTDTETSMATDNTVAIPEEKIGR